MIFSLICSGFESVRTPLADKCTKVRVECVEQFLYQLVRSLVRQSDLCLSEHSSARVRKHREVTGSRVQEMSLIA